MLDLDYAAIERIHLGRTLVRDIPLFADLNQHDLVQIMQGLAWQHVARDEYLFRQGSDADSAFFVQSGSLNVVSALPGGGEVHLASFGPGSMVGETSLVARGVRTASVRAETDVIGFSMEQQFFQALLAQANSAATRILGQLTQIVAHRLQSQYVQIISLESGSNTWSPCRDTPVIGPGIEESARPCSFRYLEYLPRFDFFSEFRENEISMIESHGHCLELPKDVLLFEKGVSPTSCFFVIRGALELCVAQGNTQVQLAVLGPGSFSGTAEIISHGLHAACGRVREGATIFEISTSKLKELLSMRSCFGLKFQLALCKNLIVDLGKINKRIARITSQASVKMGRQ
jgi:CRP-like cAMP-binding protein